MDINELQNKWSEMNRRLSKLENTISKEKFDKMKTAQEKLVTQYRMFVRMAGIFVFVSLVSWWRMFGGTMGILFAAYFLIAMIMDYILMRKVASIDVAEMPLKEVAERAKSCRRLHHICQIILIPLAVALLGALCYSRTEDIYFLWGCAAGAALGLCLGLMTYFRLMNSYKKLMR